MREKTGMTTALCLECQHSLNLGAQPYVGQRAVCLRCGSHLEVVSLRPVELDWVYENEVFKSDFEVPAVFFRGKSGRCV